MKCPLCGYEFDENSEQAKGKCHACLFGKRCKMACCPNCGYTTPRTGRQSRESKISDSEFQIKGGENDAE